MSKPSSSASRSAFGPSQRDIAEALGIAQTTVALALNPKYQSRFAASTVEMIRQKAHEMGYRPKRFAQIMRGGRSRMIGILSQGDYHQINRTMVSLITGKVLKKGFTPINVSMEWFERNMDRAIDYLRDQMVEGIIFAALTPGVSIPATVESLPKVALSHLDTPQNLPTFDFDVGNAFRDLTRHHLSIGSHHLVLLLNQREKAKNEARPLEGTFGIRIKAFAEVIREAGGVIDGDLAGIPAHRLLELPPRPKRLPPGTIRGRIIAPEWRWSDPMEVGLHMGHELLDCPRRSRPDSILGSNDAIALGVMRAAKQLGIDIPGELRLSGYDDDVTSQYLTPSLTTMEIPLDEIVDDAIEALVDQIEKSGRKHPPIHRSYATRMMIRESTAAPA